MARPKLRVRVRRHGRRAYVARRGRKAVRVGRTTVPAHTRYIRDLGVYGRGKKVLPQLKKGALGVSFEQKEGARRRIEVGKAKSYGEKKVVGRLRALQVLTKRTNPTMSRKAASDAKYIAGAMRGRKYVGYPSGFSRSRR